MQDLSLIGVIGAGQMGAGIAHVSALAGYDVCLADVSLERAEAGRSIIERNLARQVGKGAIVEADMAGALARITPTADLEAVGAVDLLIEAATENEAIKSQIFRNVTPYLTDRTLLASNTSSLSITRLAALTDRPERFMGVHFMNPVPVMKLVVGTRNSERLDARFMTPFDAH